MILLGNIARQTNRECPPFTCLFFDPVRLRKQDSVKRRGGGGCVHIVACVSVYFPRHCLVDVGTCRAYQRRCSRLLLQQARNTPVVVVELQ